MDWIHTATTFLEFIIVFCLFLFFVCVSFCVFIIFTMLHCCHAVYRVCCIITIRVGNCRNSSSFAHVYSFFVFSSHHSTQICLLSFWFCIFSVHQLLFSLLTAISSNKMFPVVFNASVKFSVSYPTFLTCHWLITSQIT